MEYAAGGSLTGVIQERSLSMEERLDLLFSLAVVVSSIHGEHSP